MSESRTAFASRYKAVTWARSVLVSSHTPILVSVIAALVVMLYIALFRNYRVNTSIDTQFYLSHSYNYCINGIELDVIFGNVFPFGQGGTIAFGKLAAILQCAALTPFNWSLVAANILSVTGVVLSKIVIFAFLVNQGFNRLGAITFCLALAATEPFVAMANQSKYEYITFFLAVCSLAVQARRQLVLAGLISVLAIEVQPIGIMAPIYLISYELCRIFQSRVFRVDFARVGARRRARSRGLFHLTPRHSDPSGRGFGPCAMGL